MKPCGHWQVKVVTGYIGLNNTVSLLIKDEALPNFKTVKQSSKFKQGSRTHKLSSNGKIWNLNIKINMISLKLINYY